MIRRDAINRVSTYRGIASLRITESHMIVPQMG